MNYGRAVRVARAAKRWSQKELAHAANLTPSYVSLIEAERRIPTMSSIKKIRAALGIPSHLMALLAADSEELKGVSEDQAAVLGRDLLHMLLSAGEIEGAR